MSGYGPLKPKPQTVREYLAAGGTFSNEVVCPKCGKWNVTLDYPCWNCGSQRELVPSMGSALRCGWCGLPFRNQMEEASSPSTPYGKMHANCLPLWLARVEQIEWRQGMREGMKPSDYAKREDLTPEEEDAAQHYNDIRPAL